MPDVKFSQLTAITAAQPADYIPIVDVSNQFMSENGSNAIITVGDLTSSFFDGLGDGSISISKLEANPTFTGNVILPSTTTIGSVNSTEIGFLSGLRNNVQYQLDNPYFNNGTVILGPGMASSAPLKISPGTNTTTLTSGNIEFDGTKLYVTNSTPTRQALATESFVTVAIEEVLDGAPILLNTLNELSAALNDDANYASTVTTALSGKEPTITAGTTAQYWCGDKTWQTLNKASVDLSNVTNESKATMFSSPTFTGTTTLSAGTTTVAPLKLTAGTNLTFPVAGSVEFDGTEIYITNLSGFRKTLTYTDHTHPAATVSANGFMSATDKSRLDDASGVNGLVKCNGSGDFSVASAGTDYAAVAHTHGNITSDGKITGAATNLPLITTTGGTISTGSFGTAANTFCAGNDVRIDNLHNVVNTSASTLTLTEADNNEYIRCSAAGGTAITLDGSGAWTVGMTVTLRRTTSAGALTLTTSNATINDNDISNVLAGDTFALKCVGITSPTNKVFDFI
jgi:hypothetical protein